MLDPGRQDGVVGRVEHAVADAHEDHQDEQRPIAGREAGGGDRRAHDPQADHKRPSGPEAIDQETDRRLEHHGDQARHGEQEAEGAARVWDGAAIDDLAGFVSFRWAAMTHWFEEDVEVFVHARDPHTRIDILQSSRHIEVMIDGVKVADSHQPRLLFETGLPVRYYLPKTDVRLDLLVPSDTHTACPYKGTAEYWHVRKDDGLAEDIVWSYPTPVPESMQIAGYLSFYNEKVDIRVDGELEARPKTHFS